MNRKALFIAAAMLSTASATEAFADCSSGFIANVLCETGVINQETANGLDGIHAGMGRPIETQILPGVADAFYPGSGNALRAWDQMNRGGGFGGGIPTPNGGGHRQAQFGNFCFTALGRAGPGHAQPVGSFCTDNYGYPGTIGM
ncbi:hypothetical protein SAMN04488498_113119 [Mesorhizobium albiziae]|uniref:Uncharacterized protein n=1 Tax=Neomesorhizobium albiziae TaxID=335020 RepID=A0A1I4CJP4_9HYPH|nr:hypothetical protein [Mesorhizobium albiziae]GLS29315.1 hypothetical protein GCM10007937_10230 [Mesorhizobium albiziae]SFK81484.1 hypothetical protein SAMN04488498_113119 [Mesorhizobium albiziae]